MPLIPTTPQQGEVPQPPAMQDLDTIHVRSITILTAPGGTPRVRVEWQEGYDDNGNFKAIVSKNATFAATPASNLETIMNAAPNGASLYAAIKNGIYQLLQDEAQVPAGTVS